MRALAAAILAGAVLSGCATFSNPQSGQAALEGAGRTYLTVKAVKAAKDPEAVAHRVRSFLVDAQAFLDKADTSNTTVATLDAAMQAYLSNAELAPEELLLFDTLRRTVLADLVNAVGDTAYLTPENLAIVKTVMADVRLGIQMAGY